MVRCVAVRWVSDEPQPGLVEVILTDADGNAWSLIDKSAVFDDANVLGPNAAYPLPVLVACNVRERRSDDAGRHLVVIDLLPWGVGEDGATYVVSEAQLTEQ